MNAAAAVVEEPGGSFELRELAVEEPRADEVLVRMAASGICHTDLTVREGTFPTPMPVVLGHEGAGTVEAVGSAVRAVSPGDRVALSYDSCGTCASCRAGRPYHCLGFFERNFGAARADGSTALARDGAAVHSHFFGQSSFSSHAVVPERSVVAIADDIPFEVVAPFGCGVQTGAGTVINALRPRAGSSIVVFGAGGVGLSAIMAARVVGCAPIVAVDLRPARLELAVELGATHAVHSGEQDVVEAVKRITGHGADFAVEACGSVSALRQAVDATMTGGVCAVVGAPPFGAEVSLDVNMVIAMSRTIRGVVEGESVPALFIPLLVDLWREGRLPVERLVQTFALSDINAAAEVAARGEVVKPVLMIPG